MSLFVIVWRLRLNPTKLAIQWHCRYIFLEIKQLSFKLTIHLQTEMKLIVHGTSHALFLYVFMVFCFTRTALHVESICVDMIQKDRVRETKQEKFISYQKCK
jgi:hypothetical protein